MTEEHYESAITPAGSLKVIVKGDEYLIRVMKPANSASLNELQRANIDILIPLINVKGGIAAYEGKLEGLPIEKHITKLREKVIANVKEEISKSRVGSFLIIMSVVALTTFILLLFF